MTPLDLVTLTPLMDHTVGSREIVVGLIDGPVALSHPDLAGARIHEVPGGLAGTCERASSAACRHGTFVAGILAAARISSAPAICPGCTLLVRPIFAEGAAQGGAMPHAPPEVLTGAIMDCVEAGARVLNLSVGLAQASSSAQFDLGAALDQAARRRVLVVAAAGNDGTLGSSIITRHPWVIPVAACDHQGRPLGFSNLGRSIGRRGLRTPGDAIASLDAAGGSLTLGGTSVAAPFVTGAIALLWSEFPRASAAQVKYAVTQAAIPRRPCVVPPLLDAWAAHRALATRHA